jgi:hypothetical protein
MTRVAIVAAVRPGGRRLVSAAMRSSAVASTPAVTDELSQAAATNATATATPPTRRATFGVRTASSNPASEAWRYSAPLALA